MRSIRVLRAGTFPALILVFTIAQGISTAESSFPITITDSSGKTIHLKAVPKRLVSLVPAATEILFGLGAGDLIVGLTWYDTYPWQANTKRIVGGLRTFSAEIIQQLKPDVILCPRIRSKIRERFSGSGIVLIEVDTRSIKDSFKMIELLGRITDRNEEAAKKIDQIKAQLDRVARKIAKIPNAKRKRVMWLRGLDPITGPGDESLQNDLIRSAGGIPPMLGKPGPVLPVTKEEWVKFNPQFIYYCGSGRTFPEKYFDMPGWKDVDAVKSASYARIPCDLNCRGPVHMGDFISWLATVTYPDELRGEKARLGPDRALTSRSLTINLPYVRSAQVFNSTLHDFPAQTLCIDFTEPMNCLSWLAGSISGITTAGNHYSSSPLSGMFHGLSINELREKVSSIVQRQPSRCSFLYTGARMDSLSVQRRQYKEIIVYALVTAGVMGNAMRAGVDEGILYQPGTINIIILSNMRLTPRARTRAIISATEAKSAALQDLDIQSSYSRCQATGTGTDQMLVVEGRGKTLESAGGHTKLGELIAKAVHDGVSESISLQNGLVCGRSVFQRIKERKIDMCSLLAESERFTPEESSRIYANLKQLLLNPAHAGFLESAFALGTAYDAGLVSNLQSFQDQCKRKCEEISGCTTNMLTQFLPDDCASRPICMALNALLNGIYHRSRRGSGTSPAPGKRGEQGHRDETD